MVKELRKNFKSIADAAKQAGLPTKDLEFLMSHVLKCLDSMQGEDERVVLLMEMLVLLNTGVTSKLEGLNYRLFNDAVEFTLIGCITTLVKEFSHGDIS